jgi:hypothetical protein
LAKRPLDQRRRRNGRGRGAKCRAGAVDQATYGAVTETERCRNLVVASAFKRCTQDHLALKLGKRSQAGQRFADREPALDFVIGAAGPQTALDCDLFVGGPAQGADRYVVHDPV